ncbi:MAG: hypothetical protein Q7V05_05745 [Methanoregula sp.]|nr:hypothetical protein [Methanoregula sp.]
MTRGRPPVKAVKDAIEMAKSRGLVWEVPENAGLPFDFVIFTGFCTWFINTAVRLILKTCLPRRFL